MNSLCGYNSRLMMEIPTPPTSTTMATNTYALTTGEREKRFLYAHTDTPYKYRYMFPSTSVHKNLHNFFFYLAA